MYFDDIYSLYLPYYFVWISTNMFSSQLHVLPPSTFHVLHVLPPSTFCVAHKDMINKFIIIHLIREIYQCPHA